MFASAAGPHPVARCRPSNAVCCAGTVLTDAGGYKAQCCHGSTTDHHGSGDTSFGHWDTDAAHFAELEIDYLKSE